MPAEVISKTGAPTDRASNAGCAVEVSRLVEDQVRKGIGAVYAIVLRAEVIKHLLRAGGGDTEYDAATVTAAPTAARAAFHGRTIEVSRLVEDWAPIG